MFSPVLRQFELNPFRLLRLPVSATTTDAALQAEAVLTLSRAGLPPEEADPLPWLPEANASELQKAAQTVEEPLMRVREQLLWFDLAHDEAAPLLQSALYDPQGEAARRYLAGATALPVVPPPLPGIGEPQSWDPGAVAKALNQANAGLLMAAVGMNGLFSPSLDAPLCAVSVEDGWQKVDGLPTLTQAHKRLVVAKADIGTRPALLCWWQRGLECWMRLLAHAWFEPYVKACIAELEDDFLAVEDAAAVVESVRARLADLAAEELRFLLVEGRYGLAREMLSVVSGSGMDRRLLGAALRPLQNVFQTEISELEPLLRDGNGEAARNIEVYLKWLGVIRQRWEALDGAGVLGLLNIFDEAVEKVYQSIVSREWPNEKIDSLLAKAGDLAKAESLRERIGARRKELEVARTRLCFFCKWRPPDYEKSVVLRAVKETGRTYSGTATTVHMLIRHAVILRCGPCGKHHEFVRTFCLVLWLSLLPGLVCIASDPRLEDLVNGIGGGLFVFVSFALLFSLQSVTARRALAFLWRGAYNSYCRLIAQLFTPPKHAPFGIYKGSEAYDSLKKDGYTAFGISPRWSTKAVAKIKK
jgi:hypothetical protein